MDIGIPREQRPDEYRVGLTPAGVGSLTHAGHVCHVERGAGHGVGFRDEDYEAAGAWIVYSAEEDYGRADLVVKVARPTHAERAWIREGQTLLAFWHLAAASPENLEMVLAALTERARGLSEVQVVQVLTAGPAEYVAPDMEGHRRVNTLCISDNVLQVVQEGRATPIVKIGTNR